MGPLRLVRPLVASLVAFNAAGGALADDPTGLGDRCLDAPEPVTIAEAIGPVTFRLADGRQVRLADVRPVDRAGADVAVADTRGQALFLPVAGAGPDRYGRIPGDVVPEATGDSLSTALLERGLAFVDPLAMQNGCHFVLFEAERRAEAAGAGVWADGDPVLSATDAGIADEAGRYAIVEGTVVSVGGSRSRIYLNFGTDYDADFTAVALRREARRWERSFERLEGRTVRIRGVVEAWNGGLIRIEHPAQVEPR